MSRIISNKTTTLLLLCFIAPLVLLFACTQNVYAEEITNSSEEAKPLTTIDRRIKEEQMRISKFSGHVRRDGDMLYLKFNSGIEKNFENLTICDGSEPCLYFDFQEYFAGLDLHVVEVHLFEGGHYLVVSGGFDKEYLMHAYPEISPDRQHVVTVSQDETGYGENSIRLWRVEQGELIEEFYFDTDKLAGYNLNSFVKWQDNRTIRINRFFYSDSSALCTKPGHVEAQFILREIGDSWKLDKEFIEGTVNCTP